METNVYMYIKMIYNMPNLKECKGCPEVYFYSSGVRETDQPKDEGNLCLSHSSVTN